MPFVVQVSTMIKAGVLGLTFIVLWLYFQCSFFISFETTFLIYLATGGWKFMRILYYTFPRDIKAFLLLLEAKRKMKKLAYDRMGIADIFRQRARMHPKKVAFIQVDGKEWTYEEVEHYSNQIANYFFEKGFKQGDTVALFMPSKPEYVCLWLGMSKIGIIPALINFNLRMNSLSHCINIVDCKAIIFDSDLEKAISDIKSDLKGSPQLFVYGEKKADDAVQLNTELESMSKLPAPRHFLTDFNGKLLYIYTSGTTGLPKAAVVIHSRFFYMAYGLQRAFKLNSDSIIYDTLPLYHTAGGILGVGQVLVNGATTVIRQKFSASKFWDDCVRYNCTGVQYIGEICRYLLAQPHRSAEKQHRVQVAFGNGLRPQIWKDFMERFNIERIGEFYGATEGNANIVNTDNKVGAIGFMSVIAPNLYPVRLIKVDSYTGEPLRHPNGLCIACKPGESGEMVGKIIKKDPLRNFDGYANSKATESKIIKNVFHHGDSVFRTGDVLEMDEFGYVYFKDRTGDTFRWKGENVSTAEVEATVSNIVQLKDAVAYGVEVAGQEGRAGMVAIVDDDDKLDLEKFYKDIQVLPPYARPLFIRKLKGVDTTGTFKLKKTDYRNEGIDIKKTKDALFYFDSSKKMYLPITEQAYDDIQTGKIRF